MGRGDRSFVPSSLTGNDILDGGVGADTMIGGFGNDIYYVDNTGDVLRELSEEGVDTVQSSITYALGANLENLTLIGTDVINGTGNELDNCIIGNNNMGRGDRSFVPSSLIGGFWFILLL